MNDSQLRGKMLNAYYDRRNNNDGWVPTSDMDFGELIGRQMIGSVGRQLADAGLIKWKPLSGAQEGFIVGMGQITGFGIDVIEGTRHSPINIVLRDVPAKPASPIVEPTKQENIPVTEPRSTVPEPEILSLKPGFWGVSVDLKALYRRLRKRF
jgi:hypothetical protein